MTQQSLMRQQKQSCYAYFHFCSSPNENNFAALFSTITNTGLRGLQSMFALLHATKQPFPHA